MTGVQILVQIMEGLSNQGILAVPFLNQRGCFSKSCCEGRSVRCGRLHGENQCERRTKKVRGSVGGVVHPKLGSKLQAQRSPVGARRVYEVVEHTERKLDRQQVGYCCSVRLSENRER